MQSLFTEKSVVVYDWTAPPEDRKDAARAFTHVPESSFLVEARAKPFFNFTDPTEKKTIGIVTAETVAKATSNFIIDNEWQNLPFDDLVKNLRDAFNRPASAEVLRENEENDFDPPDAVEIMIVQRAQGLLEEAEEEIEVKAPVLRELVA